ncbi:hypothetical protein GCM10022254_62490 [Actinomadura meridiana]|uniref:Uncharacterized protein n=1 Tax=Actinomadura meridiana TaxID=559626 RepID=A0ABP8CJL3_9ACTN
MAEQPDLDRRSDRVEQCGRVDKKVEALPQLIIPRVGHIVSSPFDGFQYHLADQAKRSCRRLWDGFDESVILIMINGQHKWSCGVDHTCRELV